MGGVPPAMRPVRGTAPTPTAAAATSTAATATRPRGRHGVRASASLHPRHSACATRRRSTSSSRMVGYRSCGSFRIARSTMCAAAAGPCQPSGSGVPWTVRCSSSRVFAAANGRRPLSISWSTTPKAKMSLRRQRRRPRAARVPCTRRCREWRPSSSRATAPPRRRASPEGRTLASPKSASLA